MRIVLTLYTDNSVISMNPDKDDKFVGDTDDQVSKSANKRDSDAKQKLGESLATLSKNKLEELNLPDNLRIAVDELKRLLTKGARAHGGMKRQKQYIGKLMRHIEIEPIQAKLDEWANVSNASKELLHQIEHWRDRIISEGDSAVAELYQLLDLTDPAHHQPLRQMHRQAKKEAQKKSSPKAARLLYKYLRDEIFSVKDVTNNEINPE